MEAIFQFVQLTKSERLEDFTHEKLNKLEKKIRLGTTCRSVFEKTGRDGTKGFYL